MSTTIEPSVPARADRRPGLGPLLATGAAAGIVGGLAGGGGGIVTVPVLDHITTLTRSENHGTSTFVNVFVAVAGVSFYIWRGGHIDVDAGLGMIVGGIIGAPLGARFAKKSSDALLRGIFITVLVLATIDLLAHAAGGGASRQVAALLPPAPLNDSLAVAFVAGVIGLVVGAWSAAMGLGGGLLAVPALVLLFGREQHVAEGTSLVIMLPNAIAGAIAHVRQGTASPRLGVIVGLGALVGSILGVGIALHLETHVLEFAFGALMIVVVVRESISFRTKYLRDR